MAASQPPASESDWPLPPCGAALPGPERRKARRLQRVLAERGGRPVAMTWSVAPNVKVLVVDDDALAARVLAALARTWDARAQERASVLNARGGSPSRPGVTCIVMTM